MYDTGQYVSVSGIHHITSFLYKNNVFPAYSSVGSFEATTSRFSRICCRNNYCLPLSVIKYIYHGRNRTLFCVQSLPTVDTVFTDLTACGVANCAGILHAGTCP